MVRKMRFQLENLTTHYDRFSPVVVVVVGGADFRVPPPIAPHAPHQKEPCCCCCCCGSYCLLSDVMQNAGVENRIRL